MTTMRWLAGASLLVALAVPAAAQQPVGKQQPPAPLPARPLAFPAFQETKLANGLDVIVLQKQAVPLVSVSLYVRSGTGTDPAGKEGRAELAAELLTKGTATRSASQLAELVERAGGSIYASAERDYTRVGCDVLAESLPLALDVVSDVARHATFADDEFQTAHARFLSSVQLDLSRPERVALRVLGSRTWGATSPYGSFASMASVQGLTAADVKAFYGASFRAGNALLVVAGDAEPAQVQALVRKWFGDWPAGAPAPIVVPPRIAYARMPLFLVHRPGSVQSNIMMSTVTMAPGSPDYRPLEVATHVLGGGTDARLFAILREQKGWTYGSYAYLWRPRLLGAFMAQAEVRTPVTDSAVAEMLKQIRRLGGEPMPAADLKAAQNYLAGSFPQRLESAASIGSQIAQARLKGLPITDVTRYPEQVMAITPVQARLAARRYLDPAKLVVVVVGDAGKVKASLEKIAPVTLLDVEGNPLDTMALKAAPAAALDGSLLKAGTVEYAMSLQATPSGTVKTTLARDGDAWVASQTITSSMFGMTSEGRMRAADLTPLSVKQAMTGGPVEMTLELKLENGRITGAAKLPEQMGGNRAFDLDAPAGTLLPGLDGYALSVLPLAAGKTITLPVLSTRSGAIENVAYQVVGEEQVKVPAGTFDTYKVDTSGENPATLWLLKTAPHTMVKMEFKAMPMVLELTTAP